MKVHCGNEAPRTYHGKNEIEAGDGAPGFRWRVAEFFPPVMEDAEQQPASVR